jgi:hypothetical protein
MAGAAIVCFFAAFLFIVCVLLFTKLKPGKTDDKADAEYICAFCGDSDCECQKLNKDV